VGIPASLVSASSRTLLTAWLCLLKSTVWPMHHQEGGSRSRPSSTAAETNAMPSASSVDQHMDEGSFFDCNICHDTPVDAVVTLCGHLYCWECIYRQVCHISRSYLRARRCVRICKLLMALRRLKQHSACLSLTAR
jgi:hypothetical protein